MEKEDNVVNTIPDSEHTLLDKILFDEPEGLTPKLDGAIAGGGQQHIEVRYFVIDCYILMWDEQLYQKGLGGCVC